MEVEGRAKHQQIYGYHLDCFGWFPSTDGAQEIDILIVLFYAMDVCIHIACQEHELWCVWGHGDLDLMEAIVQAKNRARVDIQWHDTIVIVIDELQEMGEDEHTNESKGRLEII